jgi:hypothetical protein
MRRQIPSGWAAALIVILTSLCGPTTAARSQVPDPRLNSPMVIERHRILLERLGRPLIMTNQASPVSFVSALQLVSDRADVVIIVDVGSFRKSGKGPVEDRPTTLRPSPGQTAKQALTLIAGQVGGAVWVGTDHIEILASGRPLLDRVAEAIERDWYVDPEHLRTFLSCVALSSCLPGWLHVELPPEYLRAYRKQVVRSLIWPV